MKESLATSTSPGPNHPAAPNWFARNWKWAGPLGLLALGLVFTVLVGSVFFLVETSFRRSEVYTQALARARANPQVSEKIGQPLQEGWLASGSMNTSGPSGDADLSIPINGPKGKGTLYVVAKKSVGQWRFETLQVEVEGETKPIDLLQPEASRSRRRVGFPP
jgi:hypothetical protein